VEFDKIIMIKQHYLKNDLAVSDRVRMTEASVPNGTKYFRTTKYSEDGSLREEESEITRGEYKKCTKESIGEIIKYRHIKTDRLGNTWEIDEFHNISMVIAEIELMADISTLSRVRSEVDRIEVPGFIQDELVMEVSNLKSFSNKSLAL